MKNIILFSLLILLGFNIAHSQAFIKFGIIGSSTYGVGTDLDISYKTKSETGNKFVVSSGILLDVKNDDVYFNSKIGFILNNQFQFMTGVVYVNPSTDNKSKVYTTYIISIEYNFKYIKISRGNWFTGVDFIQNKLFIKFGCKYYFK